jgi:hypothetical protein
MVAERLSGPEDFAKFVLETAAQAGPPGPFKPNWWYNRDGDQIEIYWSEEAYVGRWLNHQVTLLCSRDNPNRIIGVIIEGVKKGMERDGGLPGSGDVVRPPAGSGPTPA